MQNHFQVYIHGVSQSRLVLLSRRVSGIGPVSSLSGIPAWVLGLWVIGMSNGCWAGTGTQPPLIIPTRCKPEHQLHWFTAALGSGLNINNAWSSASHLPCGHWPAITRREQKLVNTFLSPFLSFGQFQTIPKDWTPNDFQVGRITNIQEKQEFHIRYNKQTTMVENKDHLL